MVAFDLTIAYRRLHPPRAEGGGLGFDGFAPKNMTGSKKRQVTPSPLWRAIVCLRPARGFAAMPRGGRPRRSHQRRLRGYQRRHEQGAQPDPVLSPSQSLNQL